MAIASRLRVAAEGASEVPRTLTEAGGPGEVTHRAAAAPRAQWRLGALLHQAEPPAARAPLVAKATAVAAAVTARAPERVRAVKARELGVAVTAEVRHSRQVV